MTQIGHALTGAAIGVLSLPPGASKKRAALQLAAFALLGNLPDLPFPGWGHDRYYFSHSLLVNLAAILALLMLLALLRPTRSSLGGVRVLLGGSLSWLSHLLLDSFYNHGKGVMILWPFSEGRLVLPLPWFSVMPAIPPPITPEMLRIYAIEFAFYFPLVLLAIYARYYKSYKIRSRLV